MSTQICELIISVEIYSFFNHTLECPFKRDSLAKIDELTYRAQDAREFFQKNKKEIEQKVTILFKQKYSYALTDIELGKNGVYILEKGEKKRPLFKKIEYRHTQIDLENLILSRLYRQNLVLLYACDQYRKEIEDYASVFEDFDESFLKRIQSVQFTEEDVWLFWNSIKASSRFYFLLRFLASDYSHYKGDVIHSFLKILAKEEKENTKRYEYDMNYRFPYNND